MLCHAGRTLADLGGMLALLCSALKGSLSSGLTKTLEFCDFQRTWKAPQAAWPLPGEMLVSVLSYLLVRSTNVFGAVVRAGDNVGEPEVSPTFRSSVQEGKDLKTADPTAQVS